jgi:hypothetical protein
MVITLHVFCNPLCLICQWPTFIRADNVNINEVDLALLMFLHFELKGQVQLTGLVFYWATLCNLKTISYLDNINRYF